MHTLQQYFFHAYLLVCYSVIVSHGVLYTHIDHHTTPFGNSVSQRRASLNHDDAIGKASERPVTERSWETGLSSVTLILQSVFVEI